MAARAVPIFYGLWTVYLAVFHWRELRARWRDVALFWLIYALVAVPLALYLLSHPGAEFRIGEVDAPLRALLAGDVRPVLQNAWLILRGFLFEGDPLWRQNVAARPFFNPFLALLFYAGLAKLIWRWRTPKYGFVLLWLAVSMTPSLVTADAPSSIRMINALPLLAIPVVQLMPRFGEFSTEKRRFSTQLAYIWLGVGVVTQFMGTAVSIFHTWPNNEEVQFVWQAALADIGGYVDTHEELETAVIAAWSPDTMDVPSMQLLTRREDIALSYFDPRQGTLILPQVVDGTYHLFRPTILELDPFWEAWLVAQGSTVQQQKNFVHYAIPAGLAVQPEYKMDTLFGGQFRLLGYDLVRDGEELVLTSYWRVEKRPSSPASVFVHVLDGAGAMLTNDAWWDAVDPQGLWYSHWQSGDLILQRHILPSQTNAVQLRIGIFDPYTCDPGPCQNLHTEAGAEFLLIPLED
ncbi:MAG: hypothetical protein H6662_13660 [Ardenticatenaceae bacterium]|nr:hypothetical protein [Ardenticatenaceae bacterium]